jgi:hypothetical protein
MDELPRDYSSLPKSGRFGFLEILERDVDLDEDHGAERMAILFLGADAFAAYDALFCQKHSLAKPHTIFAQDHGFGGGYESFGENGLLKKIAERSGVFPEWLMVADNTHTWMGYVKADEVDGIAGGANQRMRHLFVRSTSSVR